MALAFLIANILAAKAIKDPCNATNPRRPNQSDIETILSRGFIKMSSYNPDWNEFRDKIIGLGEESSHKNYYPELQNKLAELQRFKDLLDFTNDAIIQAKGVDGIIIEVNKPALDIFHLSKDTLIEKSIFSFFISQMLSENY